MSNYIISYETSEASWTLRFTATDLEAAKVKAVELMGRTFGDDEHDLFITEVLTENNNT